MKKNESKVSGRASAPGKNIIKASIISEGKSMNKQNVSPKSVCKVIFRLPKEAAPGAKTVSIVGDFNKWNITETKMKRLKNGDFTLTLELPCDREYSFRYLIDTNQWEKNWFADKHIPSETEDNDSAII